MVKAFLSTFALSLFFTISPDALAVDGELLEAWSTKDFGPKKEGWQVDRSKEAPDLGIIKGQSRSMIDWSEDHDSATDIHKWISQVDFKEKTPDWLKRLRHFRQMELVGNILACSGECEVVRGLTTVKGAYLSQLLEGDELKVGRDSLAWVYLHNGSLLRVSPESTVTFGEINFAPKEVFVYLKLLEGHISYHPRQREEAVVDLGPQTDAQVLPLMVEEANEEYFERQIFQEQTSQGRLNEYLLYRDHGKNHLFKKLNELKLSNNEFVTDFQSQVLIASPNMSVWAGESKIEMMYLMGGEGYLKKSGDKKIDLSLRGYQRTQAYEIWDEKWLEVNSLGRGFEILEAAPKELELISLLTKRIPSLQLAQEMWFQKNTIPIIQNLSSAQKLAQFSGYFLWSDNLSERKQFLEEYTRRLDTTHLQSLANLISKMENRGEKMNKGLSDVYFKKSLEYYLWSLKNKFSFDQMQIRETNNLQYYVWILKNVKERKD